MHNCILNLYGSKVLLKDEKKEMFGAELSESLISAFYVDQMGMAPMEPPK